MNIPVGEIISERFLKTPTGMFIFFKINQNFNLFLEFTPHFVESLKKLEKLEFTPHLPSKGLSFQHFCVLPPLENADF